MVVNMSKVNMVIIIILFITVNLYSGYGLTTGIIQVDQWKLKELARVQTGGDAYMLKVEGEYCYVSCGYSGFRIFDISDLSNPTQVALLPQAGNGYAHQFILENNIAYIGNGYGGIWIINCTEPENPTVLTEFPHDYSWDIQLVDDVIYTGNGHISAQESITITNISDLTNPVHVATILTEDDIPDLQRVGNRLYAACAQKGFLVYDISNRTDLNLLDTYIDSANPNIHLITFEVVDNYAFACYYHYGIQILDISNLSQITKVSEIVNSSSNCYSIHIIEELAYISDISGGIQIINISTITNPVEQIRYLYDNCGTNDIFLRDDILFVADRNIGLLIFQIEDDYTTHTTKIEFSVLVILSVGLILIRKRFNIK